MNPWTVVDRDHPKGLPTMRIAVAVPSSDWIMADTAYSLIRLHLHMARLDTAYFQIGALSAKTSVPAQSQNDLFQRMRNDDCDAILLIDSDMIFPPDTLTRLVAHDLDIVGAVYRMRSPPHPMAWARLDQTGRCESGLVEADYIPSGMMLVRRRVLEAMPYPWMEEMYGKSTADLVGHDPYFCRKARLEYGFQVWADLDLSREIRHIAALALPYDIGG